MTGLEGQDVAQLEYGTAQAKTSTLSFYVKASETGTYSAALVNIRPSGSITSNVTRSHIKTYTVNSANTWEYKTLTFPGCPDGTWGSSNSDGITIVLDLGSGTNHQGSTDTWLTTSDTLASGQVTLGDSNGGTWQITGLQFEVGSQATPFEHRSFGEELQLCKRYYYKSMDGNPADNIPNTDNTSSNGTFGIAMYSSTSGRTPYFQHPVQMRADPTVTVYSSERANQSGKFGLFNHSAWVATATSTPTVDINRITFSITHGSSLTAGYSYLLAGGFDADAEL